MRLTPKQQGHLDFFEFRDRNPFIEGSTDAADWAIGWDAARSENLKGIHHSKAACMAASKPKD